MQLKLYDFSKRRNSTKQPPADYPATTVEVFLKKPTSVSEPTFIISGVNVLSEAINYCLWEDRFYFVTDITYLNNDNCEVQCSIDVLATFKTQIHNMTTFVMYANLNNTEISDVRIPIKTTKSFNYEQGFFQFIGGAESTDAFPCILNITGKDSISTFAMPYNTAKNLLNNMNEWYENDIDVPQPSGSILRDQIQMIGYVGDVLRYTIKQLFSTGKASDSIKSAYVMPISSSAVEGSTSRIYLGNYDTGIDAIRITNRIVDDYCEVSIPWQALDWRRNAPYHEIFLYIPYIGLINISPSDIIDDSSIHINVSLDITCGDCTFEVMAGTGHYIGKYTTNLASTFAVGSSNITPVQTATSLGSSAMGVAGLLAGASGAGALASIGAIGLGLANSITGTPTTISSNTGGSSLGLLSNVTCYTIFHDTVVEPSNYNDVQGQPVSKVMSLSTLTGFIKCQNASIELNAHADERDKVNDFLNSGFYFE